MLIAEGIEKSYRSQKVLQGVDLSVAKGEFVSIMGESGSGKSTLLSILGGFLEPDAGTVLWNGEDISSFSEKKLAEIRSTEVGFVFQFFKPPFRPCKTETAEPKWKWQLLGFAIPPSLPTPILLIDVFL